jgi:UDP-N-acetylmuramoyl-tripeptide--D-alanyl-D-alanine ligase
MPEFLAGDLAAWTRGRWLNGPPRSVTGLSIDTRTLKPGQAYLALKGEHFDGHDFVADALAKGAAAAVTERPLDGSQPQLVVASTRRALLDMAQGHRNRLDAEFIAVTGSVGKTTVKELTADVLAMKAPTARTRGNFNNDIGLPLSLLDVDLAHRYGVMELGMNHPGELAPLCDVLKPGVGMVTAIGPVHVEFFQTVEAIAREKAAVLQSLPAGGLAVLSRDETWFDLLRSLAPCPVVTTSVGNDADYTAIRGEGGLFTVREKRSGQRTDFLAPLPGEFFVADALFAIALGRQRGIAWASLVEAVKNYRPIRMRWQREVHGGVEVINDAYNANPISMRAALQAFGETPCAGARWLLLGGMRELGAAEAREHVALGRDIGRGGWSGLIVLGSLGARVAEGAQEAGFGGKIFRCPDHAAAAGVLSAHLRPGDALLLKGSRSERVEDVLAAWCANRAPPPGQVASPRGKR